MSDIDRKRENYPKHLLRSLMGAGGAGYLFGFMGGLGTGLVTGDSQMGIEAGLKTAAVVAGGGFWVLESKYTINNAEGPERPLLHRLKGALAIAEGALAFGIPAALISYSPDNPWWTVGGAAFGALASGIQFKEKFRKQPDLIFPEGNSVVQDTAFPDRNGDTLLPKVYRSDSIKDILEFRQANQAQIARWVNMLPSDRAEPLQVSVEPSSPVNAVFITSARHFPAGDPSESREMALHDKLRVLNGESLVAGPLRHSEFFWPYHPTKFEDGPAILFNGRKWDGFRDANWERGVVILAQYQEKNALRRNPISSRSEEIVDRFWLIDVSGGALSVRRRERVTQGNSVLIPMPNPSNI